MNDINELVKAIALLNANVEKLISLVKNEENNASRPEGSDYHFKFHDGTPLSELDGGQAFSSQTRDELQSEGIMTLGQLRELPVRAIQNFATGARKELRSLLQNNGVTMEHFPCLYNQKLTKTTKPP